MAKPTKVKSKDGEKSRKQNQHSKNQKSKKGGRNPKVHQETQGDNTGTSNQILHNELTRTKRNTGTK